MLGIYDRKMFNQNMNPRRMAKGGSTFPDLSGDGEISQKDIVQQAAHRQKYIDQSQSLNLMISPKCPPKQVSELLIFGWEQGIKSFYYQRSANPSQELARSILSCSSCEG